MKCYLLLISSLMIFQFTVSVFAAEESLFPDAEDVSSKGTSLNSAVNQFERILETAPDGEIQSMDSNTSYNQDRIVALQEQLKLKRDYLQSLPGLASRQFEAMMGQYPNADQKKKDEIAYEIQTRWKSIENQAQQEVSELERQLAIAQNRMGQSQMKKQMLEISQSISKSAEDYDLSAKGDKKEKRPYKDAFEQMQHLSSTRVLSKVQALSKIHVKSLESEFNLTLHGK